MRYEILRTIQYSIFIRSGTAASAGGIGASASPSPLALPRRSLLRSRPRRLHRGRARRASMRLTSSVTTRPTDPRGGRPRSLLAPQRVFLQLYTGPTKRISSSALSTLNREISASQLAAPRPGRQIVPSVVSLFLGGNLKTYPFGRIPCVELHRGLCYSCQAQSRFPVSSCNLSST